MIKKIDWLGIFTLDLRSLALMRVGAGLILMMEMILRMRNISDHYSDQGVLPLKAFENVQTISINLLNGTSAFQLLILILGFIISILLILGYRTWLITFFAWILVLSIQNRLPTIVNGGDVLFKMMLFWCLFLPWGARFSLDAALNKTKKIPDKFLSMASAGLLLQVVFLYFFSAMLKTGNDWRVDGTAVYYALSMRETQTLGGSFLLNFPWLLKIMSYSTFLLEALGPILFLVPVFNSIIRIFLIFVFAGLHFSFLLTIGYIGLFPLVDIVILLGLLPSLFWTKIFERLGKIKRFKIQIFYDGECDFCHRAVLVLKTFLLLPSVSIYPAQEKKKIKKEMEEFNSWIVIDPLGKSHYRFDGLIVLVAASPLLFWIVPLLGLIRKLGERGYLLISNNRRFWGRIFPQWKNYDYKWQRSAIINATATYFLVYIFLFNVGTITNFYLAPAFNIYIGNLLGINQIWNMYAPNPWKDGIRYEITGEDAEGRVIVLDDKYIGYKNRKTDPYYKDHDWFYEMRAIYQYYLLGNSTFIDYYARYVCNNLKQDNQGITKIDLYIYTEYTLENNQKSPAEKKSLWVQNCE